jgi:hypothetical protein
MQETCRPVTVEVLTVDIVDRHLRVGADDLSAFRTLVAVFGVERVDVLH